MEGVVILSFFIRLYFEFTDQERIGNPLFFLCQLINCLQVVAPHSGSEYSRNVQKRNPMTRKEYNLIYSALRSYRTYMMPEDEIIAEKILDDLFYPSFDKLEGVEA